jgi:hypothetical protein
MGRLARSGHQYTYNIAHFRQRFKNKHGCKSQVFLSPSNMDRPTSPPTGAADFPEVAQAFHIANFVPVNWGAQDRISRSLVDFQFSREPQTSRWIRLALIAASSISGVDVIVRALSSKELAASGKSPLDRLGEELAQRLGCEFAPARLTKLRPTGAVKNAGPREVREKVLRHAYTFNSEGLPESAHVMILDDIVTTGATFGAITTAIKETLPQAAVSYFALAQTDPWLAYVHLNQSLPDPGAAEIFHPNADLDERYFFGASPSAEKKRKPAPARPVQTRSIATASVAEAAESKDRVSGNTDIDLEPRPDEAPGPAPARSSPTPPPPKPGVTLPPLQATVTTVLIGVGTIALFLVGYFGLRDNGGKKSSGESLLPAPPATFSPSKIDPDPVKPKPAPPRPDTRPRGVINVPLVGLRLEPSISAGSVPDVVVQKGERVIIVRMVKPDFGLQWALIETSSRKQGWVIAPVITFDNPERGLR